MNVPNVPLLILYWSQEIQDHVSDTWNMSTPYIYHHRSAERTFVMYLYFFVTIHTPYSSYLTLLYLINSGSYYRLFEWLLLGFLRSMKMMGMVLSLAEYFLIRCVFPVPKHACITCRILFRPLFCLKLGLGPPNGSIYPLPSLHFPKDCLQFVIIIPPWAV